MRYLDRVGIDHSSVIIVALLIILVDHYNLQSEFTTSVTVPQAKSKSGFVFSIAEGCRTFLRLETAGIISLTYC
jgi:hypothetical protein